VAAALAATLVVAACVQGLVGLGLGLVTSPIIILLAPELMPDVMLWLAMLYPLVTLLREHHQVHWPGLGWSLPTRVLGTAVGVTVVAAFDPVLLGIPVGLMVLLSVAVTYRAVEIPINRGTLSVAGFVSGVTGTATSIGGPPLAILYQHRPPTQIRSTLGIYFVVGAALSLAGLGLAGALESSHAFLALSLVPAMLVGFALSRFLDRWIPRHHIRSGMLTVCALSAVAALVRSLLAL
jgi:uncharacterized membrane protein YfcA